MLELRDMAGQEQVAGEGSQQFQARRDMSVTVLGVSAADVVEITHAELSRVRDELTLKVDAARSIADARLEAFERRILDAFAEKAELREAFADPDFQFSLRDASRAAVSNDDQHTEDLLVDLLKNRAEQGNHARVRLATSRAVQAADKLSLEALKGLTAVWAVGRLGPAIPGLAGGLASHESVANAVIGMGLPEGTTWTEDADTLGLVRLSSSGILTRRPYRQALQEAFVAYLNPGIELESSRALIEAATSACALLGQFLAPHPLKPGFVILPGKTQDEFLAALPPDCERTPELDQLTAQNGYGMQDQAAVAEFGKRIDQSEALSTVAAWWDEIPVMDLTVVGSVIGFLNARRYVQFGGARTIADLLSLPRN
jgi:hypothetical protein